MQYWRVRITPFVVLACAAACDSSSAPFASPSIEHATASLAVANATIHVIPALQGLSVVAINDTDEVAGNGPNGPFRWTQKAGLQYLTTKGTNGTAVATSVSDNGAVGGYVNYGDSSYYHAAVWKPDGSLRIFQLPADSFPVPISADGWSCVLNQINIYGQMVGTCSIRFPFYNPTIFEWHGPAINAPGAAGDDLNAISNDGWMGGGSDINEGGPGAFVVSPTGQTFRLRDHSGSTDTRSAVSSVTKGGYSAGTDLEGFSGTCTLAVGWLSHPGQTFPEFRLGTCGFANGITPDFYIAGTGTDTTNSPGSRFAFLWFPGAGLQHLPGLGGAGEISTAIGINTNHHVLGQIQSGGVTHTVIWYVTPSTATATEREALLAAMPR